ncbi:MAG: hypothetical protein KGL95_15920, partial [Patescibacteria group bacterium]|nr:hypothetical protein [Patescibacteria group bacterium]
SIQYLDHILAMTASPVQLRNIGEAMRIDESVYPSLLEYFMTVYDTFRTFYYQPASIAQLAQAAYTGETPLRDYKKSLKLSLAKFDNDEANLRIMATYFQVPLYNIIATLRAYADRPETLGTLAAGINLHPTTLSEWIQKYGSADQQLAEEDRAALQTIAKRLNVLGFEGGNLTISSARQAFERYIFQPLAFAELAVGLANTNGSKRVNDVEDQVRTWQRRFNITVPEYPFDFNTENALRGLAIRMTNIPEHTPVSIDCVLKEFRAFVLQPLSKTQLATLLGLRVDRLIYFIDRFVVPTMDPMLRDHERLYRDIAIRLNVPVDRARDELQAKIQQYIERYGREYSNSALAEELGFNRGFLRESVITLGILL